MSDGIIHGTVEVAPIEWFWYCPKCGTHNLESYVENKVVCQNKECKKTFTTIISN